MNTDLEDPGDVPAPRGRLAAFFLFTLVTTWTLQLPAVLVTHGMLGGPLEPWMGLAGLGGFSPLVGALLLARGEPGGIRALWRRLFRGAGTAWLPGALLLFPACWTLAAALARALAALGAPLDVPWWFPPVNAQQVAALFIVPVVEETGWRGYALPRLQHAWGPVRASAVLAAAWAAWHVMMFLAVSSSPLVLAVSLLNILVGTPLFTWLHARTRGSLAAAMLAHAGAHLDNPAHAVPDPVPLLLFTLVIGLVVAFTWWKDPRAWRRGRAPAA